ncbi:MAG: trypsin-like peptidase domain-containing protein [Acidobacteria bacterium]|nr:trypsin-like peptidase domain-containing protein [Acidobacteriota bacterium]
MLETNSRQPDASAEKLMERYRRSSQRAMLLAVAASFLAVGVLLGVALNKSSQPAQAGNKEINAELSSAFVEISQQVEASVVNISTVTQPSLRGRGLGDAPMPRQSLDSFSYGSGEGVRRGNGSGVIVDAQGYILTNHHVIEGADRIKAKLHDGTELPARVIGSDREVDLAVIKVDAPMSLTPARFGDSEKMRVGDWVLAIGSPFGFEQTVTAGIISARERDSSELYKKVGFQYFLQTDAAINRGNSGGPLINLAGEVIGINSAIATSTGDYNGICFALPSSEAISLYKQLIKNGRVVRGFLGAMTDRVTPQIAKVYGLPVKHGAIVSNISETVEVDGQTVESPAAKAGLKLNDVIIEYRGHQVKDDAELVRRVASTPVGTTAPLKIFRDGREMELQVSIGRRPGREKAMPAAAAVLLTDADEAPRGPSIGLRIETLTQRRLQEKELGDLRGVLVVRIEPGSVAEDAGLRLNDVIESFNRDPIRDTDEFKSKLASLKPNEPVVLQVYRQSLAPNPRIFLSLNKP